MGVTPSGYDITFFDNIVKDTSSYQLRLIINKKGHIRCDIVDRELNYIAEEVNVYVTAKHLTLLIDSTKISAHFKSATMSIFAVLDTYKDIAFQPYVETDFKETRRCDTDEKLKTTPTKTYHNNYMAYTYKGTNLLGDEEDGF